MTEQVVTLRLKTDASGVRPGVVAVSAELDKVGRAGQQAGTQVQAGMAKGSAGAAQMARSAAAASMSIKDVVRQAAALAGIALGVGFVRQLAQMADGYTNLTSKIRNVTDSEESLARVRQATFGIAQQTRQEFSATAELYTRLTRATADLGLAESQRLRITETINKAMVVSGATTQESAAAIIQLSQGLAAGALRGEEFNSVAEQAPILIGMLTKSLGMSRGELRAYAQDGKLSAEIVTNALLEGGAAVDAQFGNMALTIAGASQQLSNAALKWVGDANEGIGASATIASAISSVAKNFGSVANALLTLGEIVATVYAARFIYWGGLWITSLAAQSAALLATGAAAQGFAAVTAASFQAAYASMGLLGIGLNLLASAFIGWKIGTYLRTEFQIVADAGNYLVYGIAQGWEELKRLTGVVWAGITYVAIGAIDSITEAFAMMLRQIASASSVEVFGTKLLGNAPEQINALADSVSAALTPLEDLKGSVGALQSAYETNSAANAAMLADMQNATQATFEAGTANNSAAAAVEGFTGSGKKAALTAKQIADAQRSAAIAATELADAQSAWDTLLDKITGRTGPAAKAQSDYAIGMRQLEERAIDLAVAGGDVVKILEEWQDGEAALKLTLADTNAEIARQSDVVGRVMDGLRGDAAMAAMTERQRFMADAVLKARDAFAALSQEQQALHPLTTQMTDDLALQAGVIFDQVDAANALADAMRGVGDIGFDKLISQIDLLAKELERISNKDLMGEAFDPKRVKDTRAQLGELRHELLQGYVGSLQEGIAGLKSMATEGSAAYGALTVAQNALNLVTAIGAIATQGLGDPWTAFARIAAMIAAMASLGLSPGGGAGGFSGGAAQQQATQGTGSILGDATAKSESIANAIEITADASREMIGIQRGMLRALQAVQAGLSSAGNLLARGAGDQTFTNMGPASLSSGMSFLSSFSLAESLFGGLTAKILGAKKEVTDMGIRIVGGALGELIENVSVGAYQQVSSRSWWFGSTRTNTQIKPLGDDIAMQFQLVLDSIGDAVREGARALGLDMEQINAQIAAYQIAEIKISTKGLSAEEAQAELAAVFSKIFDGLAGSVVPFIAQFQQVGEGLGETLVRVATGVQVMGEAVKQLGFALDVTDPEQFAIASEGLIDLAGGLEEFIAGMSSFVNAFATDEHRLKVSQDALTSAFDQYGLKIPDTRDGMWELMASLDATTESGREQIATLLRLADTADSYYSELENQQERVSALWTKYWARFHSDAERAQTSVTQATTTATGEFGDIGLNLADFTGAGGMEALRKLFEDTLPTLSTEATEQWLEAAAALVALIDASAAAGGSLARTAEQIKAVADILAANDAALARLGMSDAQKAIADLGAQYDAQRVTLLANAATAKELWHLEEQRGRSMRQLYDDFVGQFRQLPDANTLAGQIEVIRQAEAAQIEAANAYAIAAGMEGIAAADLANIHRTAAEQIAAAQAQFRAAYDQFIDGFRPDTALPTGADAGSLGDAWAQAAVWVQAQIDIANQLAAAAGMSGASAEDLVVIWNAAHAAIAVTQARLRDAYDQFVAQFHDAAQLATGADANSLADAWNQAATWVQAQLAMADQLAIAAGMSGASAGDIEAIWARAHAAIATVQARMLDSYNQFVSQFRPDAISLPTGVTVGNMGDAYSEIAIYVQAQLDMAHQLAIAAGLSGAAIEDILNIYATGDALIAAASARLRGAYDAFVAQFRPAATVLPMGDGASSVGGAWEQAAAWVQAQIAAANALAIAAGMAGANAEDLVNIWNQAHTAIAATQARLLASYNSFIDQFRPASALPTGGDAGNMDDAWSQAAAWVQQMIDQANALAIAAGLSGASEADMLLIWNAAHAAIAAAQERLTAAYQAIVGQWALPLPEPTNLAEATARINQWMQDQIAAAQAAALAAGMLGIAESDLAAIHANAAAQIAEAAARLQDAADAYSDFLEGIRRETFGVTEFQGQIRDAMDWQTQAIARAHELARAAGMAGASEQALALIELRASQLRAAAIAQLREETQSLIDQLYGAGVNVGDSIGSGIESAASAAESFWENQLQQIQTLNDYLDSMLFGDLSALTPDQQLAEAYRQLQEAIASGDAGSATQMAEAYLRLLREAEASGADYNAGFFDVRAMLQAMRDGLAAMEPPGGSGGSGYITPADAEAIAAANRLELATQLAAHLGDLAGALGQSVFDLMETLGVDLRALTTDLGINLDAITGQSVTALAGLAAMLGVNLADLTSELGLTLSSLGAGISELATGMGIDLHALTVESTGALGALANQLGLDLSQLAGSVGVNLGSLADAQSLLNQALAGTINGLPEGTRNELEPLLAAITSATNAADANAAIDALNAAVNLLAPDIRNLLAPYLEGVFPTAALSDLDYLSVINSDTTRMAQALDVVNETLLRIADNTAAQNSASGLPSFAVGADYIPRDMVANIHRGEMIIPAMQAGVIRARGGISVPQGGGASQAELRMLREQVARLEAAIDRNGGLVARAVVETGVAGDRNNTRAIEEQTRRLETSGRGNR